MRSERPSQIPIKDTSFSEEEEIYQKLKKISTNFVGKNDRNKEMIDVFSEFMMNTMRAEKDESLLFSKYKSYKEELIQASSQLFAAQSFDIDPCKGMDHVSQVHFNDQLKDFFSPFDTHQIVQTLQIPSGSQFGLFLTVHLVNQNVLAEGITLIQDKVPQHPYMLCNCGFHPVLDSEDKQSELPRFSEKCQFCDEKFENMYRCGLQEVDEKIDQNEQKKCDFKSCPRCFANYFLKIVQKHKLKNHAVWEPCTLEKKQSENDETVEYYGGITKVPRTVEKQIECATIAVIGAWQRNGKSTPICLKQFQVTEPLFFPKNNEKSYLDLTFIHTGEKGELFFFQKSGQSVYVSVIRDELENEVLDKKSCSHYPDLFDLPIRAERVLVQTESKTFEDPACKYYAPIMKQQPRLAGDYILFSSKVVKEEQDFKDYENSISTSFYNLRTGHEMVVLNAFLVLLLKIENKDVEIQEVTYLQKQGQKFQIVKVLWEDIVKGQLEFQINRVSYTNPKPHQQWIISKPELEDLEEFYRGEEMIHGAIHSNESRCSILSQTKMHWVSYFMTAVDEIGVKTLKKIPDSQRSQEKPFTFYHDIEKDKFIILQGLQKIPEISSDKQYQKFEMLCLDQSQSQEDDQPGEEEEVRKDYFKTTKITVFLPIELLSGHDLQNYSLRILNITTDDFSKVQLSAFVQVSLSQVLGSAETASKFVFLTNITEKPKRSAIQRHTTSLVHMQTSHDTIDASFGYILPSQDYSIEYPILVQTTYHPKRNQIILSNLTINQPKLLISLDKFRFVSFVHSSLVDEDLEQSSQDYSESNNFHAVKLDSGTVRIHILVCEERDPKRALRLMWFEVSTIDCVSTTREIDASNKLIEVVAAVLKSKVQTKSYRQLNYGLFKAKIELPQVLSLEQIKKVIIFRAKKNQSPKLDICLVFQTVDRVFPYLLFDKLRNKKMNEKTQFAASLQTEGKIVPTHMVCGPDFSCFYVVGSKQGYQVLAMYSETNNTEKIRIDVIVTQEEKIVKIQVRQDYKQKKTLRLVVLDVFGKVKEYELVKRNGQYLVGKSVKSLQISKKQYQLVESMLKNQNWTEFILQETSLIALKEDGQNFIFQSFSDLLSQDLFDKRNKREGERRAIAARPISWIEKHCFVAQIGTYSFIQVKPNFDSNILDFTSRRINRQLKGIHTLRRKVVIELSTSKPNSSIFVYYNSADMMLSHVNYHRDTQILSGPNSKGNYFAQKVSHENLQKSSIQEQKVTEDEYDLYVYQQDGLWKKQFSYNHLLDELMLNFFQDSTGQLGNSSTDYWCWRSISQSCGIARESGDTSGPQVQDDGTLTMVYFMCPQSSQKSSLLRTVGNEKVLTFTEDETTASTRIFKVAIQQDVPVNYDPTTNYHRHTYIPANQSGVSIYEQCVSYIIETSRQVKAKAIFTKNYLLWVTEKGKLYFARLTDIDKNQRIFIQDVSSSGFAAEPREDTSIKTFRRLLQPNTVTPTKCGVINLKQMISGFQYQEFSIFVLNDMDRHFVVRDEKSRQDVIQIQFNGVSTIWDLKECEEITYLIGADNQFDLKNFVRTGHLLRFTKLSSSGKPAQLSCFRPNYNQTLFVCQTLAGDRNPENVVHCFRLYSQRDLQEIFDIQRHLNDGLSLRNLNLNLFVVNIMNRTFFDLFSQNHQVLTQASESLSQIELEPVIDEENEFEQNFDHIYFRKLYQTVLCPIAADVASIHIKLVSNIFRRESTRSIQQIESSETYQMNIMQKALIEDPIMFNVLLKIILLSKEVRLSNLVTSLQNFKKLFQSQSQERNSFMEKASLQTNASRKITGLETSSDDAEIMFFGSNTTMLSEKQIRQRFTELHDSNEEEKELFEYKIVIMETEWLTDVAKFYQAMRNADPLVYENKMIQFIRNELDFKNWVVWLMFVPYCIYMAMVCYYFCVFITDEAQFHLGFFHGKPFSVVLRVCIIVFTAYFFIIELRQIKLFGAKYFFTPQNYPYLLIYLLVLFVIFEHSTKHFVGIDALRLAQVASVTTLLLWFNLYYWMRLFSNTAMYVDMINQTIYDVRYFLLLVVIEVCAFGNAIMILNYIESRQNSGLSTDYQPLYQKAFGVPLIDAIISQYTLGLGNFDTGNFNENQSVVLCWIYFLSATFFTQIMFINMIIAIMGTTYDNVRENADRNALIMQTRILSDYILFAPTAHKFSEQRYLYLATRVKEETQSSFDIIQSMKSMNSNIKDGFETSKDLVDEMKLQQAEIIDQLQTVQKDYQQHEKELVHMTQEMKIFMKEQKEEAKIREQNQIDLQDRFEKLKYEVKESKDKLSQNVKELSKNVSLLLNHMGVVNQGK